MEDREQNVGDEKERAGAESDVEGHQQVERGSEKDETDESDVEGHAISPQVSPQADG